MKKMKYISLALLLLTLASCSKENTYSCDSDVNAWVLDNLDEIHRMTRSEWIDLGDIAIQRGAYTAFTTQQKQSLWSAKFDELLKLDWTTEERSHLRELANTVHNKPIWFDLNCPEQERDAKELFQYRWLNHAVETLGWSHELIYAIVFTPERMNATKQLISSPAKGVVTKTRSESGSMKCDCNNPESAHYFTCPQEKYNCRTGSCSGSNGGCGWFWSDPCNGLCYTR